MSDGTATSSRRPKWLLALIALGLANSAFLAVANRMPWPPRQEFTAFLFLANVGLHLALGALALMLVLVLGSRWRAAILATRGPGRLLGALGALGFFVCLVTGVMLAIRGSTREYQLTHNLHDIATLVCVVGTGLWLVLRAAGLRETPQRRFSLTAAWLIAIITLPGLGLVAYAGRLVAKESHIINDGLAPASMEEEGDGPAGKFWPSSVKSVGNRFFPPEYFIDSKTCGEEGCHPDIYKQWFASAHKNSSFNNQWYRKSIEYMQEVVGTKPSKWCGGCHDMAILLTEMPGTGKSRMDFPIKDQIFPEKDHPEAHAGIGCAACHSMVHVPDTMGQGNYVADYPPMHKYILTTNPVMKEIQKYLTRIAPGPHRKTFLKPFHKDDTAKFCASCHKVHLDKPVNNYRWFRGFNDYDPWQASGVSSFGARSFYYPNKDGKPDFKKCKDCHMKLVPSKDAGNIGGKVHDHRFLAANTALPYVNHDTEQLALTQKFLRDGALSIDIFAIRREKGGATPARSSAAPSKASTASPPEGQTASLVGEVASTGHSGSLVPSSVKAVEEDIIAPLDRGVVAVQRGESVVLEVVVRTRKVGHAFPGGTFDAFDVWVELQAKDENGKVLLWSGALEWPGGPIDRSAHQYRAFLVDDAGNEINKRNAWAARARVYARAIPPGAADTVHYRLRVPKDCGNRIDVTAKLHYRKFSWFGTMFSFGGRPVDPKNPNYSKDGFLEGVAVGKGKASGPVTADYDNRAFRFDSSLHVAAAKDRTKIPDLPITTLCESAAKLAVVSGDPKKATAPRALDVKKDRERWNDYGIGLMLQGDFQRATKAFEQVCKVSADWAEGYVNLARVKIQEGDIPSSVPHLEKALGMYDAKPTPMTPFLKARTQFFYGLGFKARGRQEKALEIWRQAAQVFPDDRELRNQMGRVYFNLQRFEEALKEFKHVLTIDPEDLTANYNLMLCYRALGPQYDALADRHYRLYSRFKNDETKTHLAGELRRKDPHANLEAQNVHEHESGPVRLPGPPSEVRKLFRHDQRLAAR